MSDGNFYVLSHLCIVQVQFVANKIRYHLSFLCLTLKRKTGKKSPNYF